MSTTKKALKNGIWNAAEVSIYPFLQLLLMPVFLNFMGATQFGFWMLANSIVGSFSLFYVGIVDSSIWQVASAQKTEKSITQKIGQTLSTTLFISLFASFSCFILGTVLYAGIVNYHWFGVDTAVIAQNPYTILGLTLFSGIKILEQSFLSIFKGLEKYETSSMFGLSSKMLILIVNFYLAYTHASLDYFYLSASIITLISAIGAWRLLYKKYAIQLSFRKDVMQTASNINFAKWSWVQSLFVMLSNQVDKLIVSTYAGLEMLSYYSIGFMVFAQLHNFFAALGAWLFPYSARLKEDLSLFKSFKNKGLNYSVALSMVMLTALSVLEMPLFEVWLGADKYIQASLFIHYFIAFESIMLITIVPYYLLNGSGFVKQNTLMEIAFKILNIVLYTSLYFMLGTTGLMLGLIISASLYVPFQHQYSQLLLVKSSIEKQSILSFLFLFASVLIYLLQFDYYQLALGTILALFLVLNKQSLLAIFSTLKPLKA